MAFGAIRAPDRKDFLPQISRLSSYAGRAAGLEHGASSRRSDDPIDTCNTERRSLSASPKRPSATSGAVGLRTRERSRHRSTTRRPGTVDGFQTTGDFVLTL
jgi:hypothetical protein